MAAADAMMGIENQPRAAGVDDLLEGEWNWLILKAWTVAEQIARMQPGISGSGSGRPMGHGLDAANSVIQAYMALGITK
jgi:hypothetical protein